MDKRNYGSLEACKKLVEKGIVIETEMGWEQLIDGKWCLVFTKWATMETIPAPSMAEMWRELPEYIGENAHNELVVTKTGIHTNAGYNDFTCNVPASEFFSNENPTDTLIYLRIWLEEQKEEKK